MHFEIYPGNLFFMGELFVSELLFMYPVPKRKNHLVRLLCSILLSQFFAALISPIGTVDNQLFWNLLRFTLLFSASIALMYWCFDLQLTKTFFLCVAGYTVQHMAYRVMRLALGARFSVLLAENPALLRSSEVGIILVVYLIVWATLGLFCARNECYRYPNMRFNLLSCITIFICIGANRLIRVFGEDPNSFTANMYAFLNCILALYIQFMLHKQILIQNENQMLQLLRQESEKKYEISKNTMEALSIRVHDLKHLLGTRNQELSSQEAESIQREIQMIENAGSTGSAAIDILLMEKRLQCQNCGIRLDCFGDFSALEFMSTVEIYSLFGNAIDNAIEAVQKLTEPGKKTIEISVERKGACVFASFTNYYSGTLEMADGFPSSTKAEDRMFHGFGLKSMRRIARKYGGNVSVSANGELFNLVLYVRNAESSEKPTSADSLNNSC